MCGCLLCAPNWGTWPATQACALTGNQPRNPFVRRPAPNPLSHASQSIKSFLVVFAWLNIVKSQICVSIISLSTIGSLFLI